KIIQPSRPPLRDGPTGQRASTGERFSMSSVADTPLIPPQAVLSFDVEEHWRIEAASALSFDDASKGYYAGRVGPPTYWLLAQLARHGQRATFFVVGQLAREQPGLVRAIRDGG